MLNDKIAYYLINDVHCLHYRFSREAIQAIKIMNLDTVHLWVISLDAPIYSMEECTHLLSIEEKKQVERFRFQEQKRRYTLAHASLRKILSKYMPGKPETIHYEINAFGKPTLGNQHAFRNIQFNLSHSGELALIAICQGRQIGVDIEMIRPLHDYMKVAKRYFAPDEVSILQKMDPLHSRRAFIQLWAGKEALIKAQGSGMSIPLNRFSLVELIESSAVRGCKLDMPGGSSSWFVQRVKLVRGYLGALAVEGEIKDITYRKA
jgi:4'-phosphopantetheinyl transferase